MVCVNVVDGIILEEIEKKIKIYTFTHSNAKPIMKYNIIDFKVIIINYMFFFILKINDKHLALSSTNRI